MARKRRSNESVQIPTPEPDYNFGFRRPSPSTLTVSTMAAVAIAEPGVRLSRAERAHVAKFRVWALIGDSKAVAVRPRMTEREFSVAARLLTRKPQPKTFGADGSSRQQRHDVRTWHSNPMQIAA